MLLTIPGTPQAARLRIERGLVHDIHCNEPDLMQARTYRAAPDMRLKFLTLLQIAGGTTGLWISRSELAPLDLVEKLDQREAQKTCFFFLDRKTRGLGLKITRVRIRVRVEIKGG